MAMAPKAYARFGRCLVAVSEGIVDESGAPIAAKFSREVDSYGNAQLSGMGALGDLLVAELKIRTKITRVRADTFGYLQRSFPAVVSAADAREARHLPSAALVFLVAVRAEDHHRHALGLCWSGAAWRGDDWPGGNQRLVCAGR